MPRSLRVLLAAALAALILPAAAQGAVRLGPDVTIPPPSGGFHLGAIGCNPDPAVNPCTYVNTASTNPDVVVASPIKGVVTAWSFRAGCCTDPQTVAHHITLGTFRPASTGATAHLTGDTFELPPGNQILADTPTMFPARVPIEAGETVGAIADYPIGFTVNDTFPGVTATVFFKGYTSGYPYPGATIYLSARVEPDADGDGYGDETQDCSPADPATHDQGCAPPVPTPIVNPPSVGINCSPGCPSSGGGGGTLSVPILPPNAGTVPPSGDPNRVYISLSCPPKATQPCGGYLLLVPGGAKKTAAVRTRYTIAPGKTKAIKIPLTAKLRKQLKRTGRVTVTLRLQPDGGGKATTIRRTIKLKKKSHR